MTGATTVTSDGVGDWRERLKRLPQADAANTERSLFRELNHDREFTPILTAPPTNPRPASVMIPIVETSAGPEILLTVRTPTMPSHAASSGLTRRLSSTLASRASALMRPSAMRRS